MSEHILVDGNWKKATKVQLDGIPVGFSLPFRATQPPYGWLVEDGREISRTTYAKLFSIIGTMYGEGDGETTFNLPNSIGKYTKFGIGEEVGTELEAGLPEIQGKLGSATASISGAFASQGAVSSKTSGAAWGEMTWYAADFLASRSSSIYGNSDTVTPPSLVALPCIKAFDTIADEVKINLAAELETLKGKVDTLPELTDERVIGTYNGNKVYEKILNFTSPSTTRSYTPTLDVSHLNIDFIIDWSGHVLDGGGNFVPIAYALTDGGVSNNATYFSKTTMMMFVGSTNHAGKQGLIKIHYTKTTD